MANNRLPTFDKQKVLIDLKRKIKEGKSAHEITQYIKENYNISLQSITIFMKEAKELLQRELDFNYRDIMIKHSGRYEQIWKKNFANPYSKILDDPEQDMDDQDVRKTLFKIAKHYMTASKALLQKEKMLGITHSRMDVELKNEFLEQEEKNKPEIDVSSFDLSKLTLEEKIEMLHLLKKAKGEVQENTTSVTTKITVTNGNKTEELPKFEPVVEKMDIEDIQHEEVIEETAEVAVQNINKKLLQDQAKKLDDKLKSQRDKEKVEQMKRAKQKIIQKYKKKK